MALKVLIIGAGGIGSEAIDYILEKRSNTTIYAVDKNEKALSKLDDGVEKYNIDIQNYEEINELSEEINIDILVNGAGYQKQGSVEDMSMEKFEEHINTNYLGAVNCVKAFLPDLKEVADGKIINISSVAGKTGFPFLSGYCASKYALEGFTDSLRKELLEQDLQVVLVEPGRVKTGFNEKGVKNMENYVSESVWSDEYEKLLKQESYGGISKKKAGRKLGKIILKNKNRSRYTINKEANIIMALKLLTPTKLYDKIVGKVIMNK